MLEFFHHVGERESRERERERANGKAGDTENCDKREDEQK